MNLSLQNKPPVQGEPVNSAVDDGEANLTPSRMPTADDYAEAMRRRNTQFLVGGVLLAAAVVGIFAGFGMETVLPPVVLLLMLTVPLLLWRYPRLPLYVTLAAACLFETGQLSGMDGHPFADSLTDRVPIFWNINTILQIYGHTNFKGVPLNLFEIFVLVAGVCSLLRAVYSGTAGLRGGPLLVPISVYLFFVIMGWINGILTGGDFKISLQEVRPQFYFGVAYLMAVNIVREKRDITRLLWVAVICIGVKGILLTFRRYVTLHGLPLPDQGVGSHEDAFFMDAFLLLLLCLSLCRVLPKIQRVMWMLLPFVALADLALNRRAATAAMVIAVPIILLAAYQSLPDRRRQVAALAAVMAVSFSIYYPLFKNSENAFAQPARAIKSNFQPDARDASSNASRDNENLDLMATIHSAPAQGYGYGRPFFQIVPMNDVIRIYDLEPFIPHNQILWIWERVGSFGFLAFWMMISSIIIFAGQTVRAARADGFTKAVGIFALLMTTMLVLFGLLDLQLSNFRDVLFVGIWAGVLGALPTLKDSVEVRQAAVKPPAKRRVGAA